MLQVFCGDNAVNQCQPMNADLWCQALIRFIVYFFFAVPVCYWISGTGKIFINEIESVFY